MKLRKNAACLHSKPSCLSIESKPPETFVLRGSVLSVLLIMPVLEIPTKFYAQCSLTVGTNTIGPLKGMVRSKCCMVSGVFCSVLLSNEDGVVYF